MFRNENPILRVSKLKKYFKSKGQIVKAVDDVSFDLHKGEIIGLIGESGSGKTTVGNILLRLIPGSTGVIQFEDKIVSGKNISRSKRKFLHKNMQMTFQNPFASLDQQKNVFSILSEPLRVNKVLRKNNVDLFSDWMAVTKVSQLTFKKAIVLAEYEIKSLIARLSKAYFTNLEIRLKDIEAKWDTQSLQSLSESLYYEYYIERIDVNRKIISFCQKKIEELTALYDERQYKYRNNQLSKEETQIFYLVKEKENLEYLVRHKYHKGSSVEQEEAKEQHEEVAKTVKVIKTILNSVISSLRGSAKYSHEQALNSQTNAEYNFYYTDYKINKNLAIFLKSKKERLLYLTPEEVNKLEKTLKIQAETQLSDLILKNTEELKNNAKARVNRRFANSAIKKHLHPYLDKEIALSKARADEWFKNKNIFNQKRNASDQEFQQAKQRLQVIDQEIKNAQHAFNTGKQQFKVNVVKEIADITSHMNELASVTAANKEFSKRLSIQFNLLYKKLIVEMKSSIKKIKSERKSNPNSKNNSILKNIEAGITKFKLDIQNGKVTNKSFEAEIKIYFHHIETIRHLYRLKFVPWFSKQKIKMLVLHDRVNKALKEVGLKSEHAYRYPHEFSGGQRQRIVIARALISNPKVIIADEPIASLDISIQAQIVNLLTDLCHKKGISMIFIAHDLSMVEYISNNILIMHLGKLVEFGSSEQIFKKPVHPYTRNLFNSIPRISNANVPFKSDNFELTYLKEYSPFNAPKYFKVDEMHYVLGTENQIYKWTSKYEHTIDDSMTKILDLSIPSKTLDTIMTNQKNKTIKSLKKVIKKLKPKKIKPKKTKNSKKNIAKPKTQKQIAWEGRYIIQKARKTSGWEIKHANSDRATFVLPTKKEAQEKFKTLESGKKSILVTKGRHGKFHDIKKAKKLSTNKSIKAPKSKTKQTLVKKPKKKAKK